jgi:flagellar hook-basal body complex protein FliE
MERVDINRVLVEMRALKAQAQGRNLDIPSFNKVDNQQNTLPQFGDVLKTAVDKVNATQLHADQLAKAFETGDTRVDLPDVMIAVQKANISFEAMKQVRNKLVAAYQEIMNMPV